MGKLALHICFFLFSLTFIISIGIASNPEILDSKIGYIHNRYHHLQQHKREDKIGIYELSKGNFSIKLTNYGATVISVILPDKYGKLADVVLGYDMVNQYMELQACFGFWMNCSACKEFVKIVISHQPISFAILKASNIVINSVCTGDEALNFYPPHSGSERSSSTTTSCCWVLITLGLVSITVVTTSPLASSCSCN